MVNKSAAIVIQDRKVLYLRKKNFLFFILPGGKIESGETEEQALEREMMEEVSARIKVIGHLGVIESKGFNKSLDELEPIRLSLYHVELLDEVKLSNEIIDQEYLTYKNIHHALLSPVGIRTLEFLHQKGLID